MTTESEPLSVLGKIKVGAGIFQDHRWGEWPNCLPPNEEYAGEEYQYVTKYPDRLFEAVWSGRYWDCKADGYGHLKIQGDLGTYGNGSIFVSGFSGLEIVEIVSGVLPDE